MRHIVFILVNIAILTQLGFSQIPVKDLPGLTDITFHERTVFAYMHTYTIDIVDINTKLSGSLGAGNMDFEGVPNKEFYDVYYSDADGNFDLNGTYVNIDAEYIAIGKHILMLGDADSDAGKIVKQLGNSWCVANNDVNTTVRIIESGLHQIRKKEQFRTFNHLRFERKHPPVN